MPDFKKRQTLKFIGAAPLVSLPFVASASTHGLTDSGLTDSFPDLPAPAPRTSMQLEIQIIDSTAVPDNQVVFRNRSDDKLIITRFMPGHIVFGDKLIDLNAAMGDRAIELQSGQSKVLQFDVWSVVNAGPIEYVWGDHATDVLNAETSVINMGAFMADTNAIVYANTKDYLPA